MRKQQMTKTNLFTVVTLLVSVAFMINTKRSEASPGAVLHKISQSVAMTIMKLAAKSGKTKDVVIDHELQDVTPEMITWWWDNIDTTERYKLWHPHHHMAYEWIVPPGPGGHVGAIQLATETIGGVPIALRIRWDDPGSVETLFEHVLAASILTDQGEVLMKFSHEYGPAPYGTRMRSTFHVFQGIPGFIRKGLARHNREEMSNFGTFLPELYHENKNSHLLRGRQ
jgi:hypothetical protein